jgi:hypothetical protein
LLSRANIPKKQLKYSVYIVLSRYLINHLTNKIDYTTHLHKFGRQNDPLELNDISREFPEVTRSMMQRLVDWRHIPSVGDSTQEKLNEEDVDIFAPWLPARWNE